MKIMLRSLAILVATLIALPIARSATLTFDENAVPTNPINTFGSFTFGGLGGGAVTDGPTSLIIDADEFGGIGVDFVVDDGNGNFVPQDFAAGNHQWEMRVKLLPGNVASTINTSFIDDDGAGAADEHQYNFDLTSIPDDGQFHSIFVPLISPGFTQTAFGFTTGDTLVNPGARQIQIQSVFGSTDRLHVEVDFVQIAPIPEPASIGLACLGCLMAGAMSRRKAK